MKNKIIQKIIIGQVSKISKFQEINKVIILLFGSKLIEVLYIYIYIMTISLSHQIYTSIYIILKFETHNIYV